MRGLLALALFFFSLILGEEAVREAEGTHAADRSDLLPHLRAGVNDSYQKINLEASRPRSSWLARPKIASRASSPT